MFFVFSWKIWSVRVVLLRLGYFQVYQSCVNSYSRGISVDCSSLGFHILIESHLLVNHQAIRYFCISKKSHLNLKILTVPTEKHWIKPSDCMASDINSLLWLQNSMSSTNVPRSEDLKMIVDGGVSFQSLRLYMHVCFERWESNHWPKTAAGIVSSM